MNVPCTSGTCSHSVVSRGCEIEGSSVIAPVRLEVFYSTSFRSVGTDGKHSKLDVLLCKNILDC
jgi:hypothetical protein